MIDPTATLELDALSGTNETRVAGTSARSVVQLTLTGDIPFGTPKSNYLVQWTVTSGGGSVTIENPATPVTGSTDDRGQSAAVWTLGPVAGPQTLTATLITGSAFVPSTDPEHIVTFQATGTPAVVAVGSLTLTPETATIAVADSVGMGVVVRDAQGNALTGRAISFTTSNQAVATVGATGVVRGVSPGEVDVIASSEGRADTARVRVTAPTCPATGVCTVTISTNGNRTSLQVGHTLLFQAIVRDAAGNPITSGATVSYATSDATIATVAAAPAGGPPGYFANITGVRVGRVTISATANGQSGSAVIDVTP